MFDVQDYKHKRTIVSAIRYDGHNLPAIEAFCWHHFDVRSGQPMIHCSDDKRWDMLMETNFIIQPTSNPDGFYVSPEDCFKRNYFGIISSIDWMTEHKYTSRVLRYEHRPITVSAFELTEENADEVVSFIERNSRVGNHMYRDGDFWKITRPKSMAPRIVSPGDIIVFNGRGCYGMTRKKFDRNYEPV